MHVDNWTFVEVCDGELRLDLGLSVLRTSPVNVSLTCIRGS